MKTLLPSYVGKFKKSKLQSVSLRGFGGGWNAIDDDISMNPKYLVTAKNIYRTSGGGQAVRFGNRWFSDIKAVNNSPVVDAIYFSGRLVCVSANGHITTITDAGTVAEIWNPAICAALPGTPAFWSAGLTLITFVGFKNILDIHNGVDKPVSISSAFAVTYLQDLGTGSNTNVPIGKYAATAANYHCIAGFAASPTEIVISSKGTDGTFPLDPIPNDSISIDVGPYVPDGANEIRGLAGYRSYLIVFMESTSLIVQLGIYDDTGAHTPKFPDTFGKFGLIGSRCISKIETDLIFAGLQGLSSASKNIYSPTQLDSTIISSVIEPEYQKRLGALTNTQKQLNTFTVYDQLGHNLMLFTPGGHIIVYTSNAKLNYKAWSEYVNMTWTCGCTSLLGRVFLFSGTKCFQLGNNTYGEKYYADLLNDHDKTWAIFTPYTAGDKVFDPVTEQSFVAQIDHSSFGSGTFAETRIAFPNLWVQYLGESIAFDMELPWFDGRDPMQTKHLRFVKVASRGTAEFRLEAYVDELYKDDTGVVIYDPAIYIDLVGNYVPGYGVATEDYPYGSGIRSRDPRLIPFNTKFNSVKFRIFGSTKRGLEIINLSFLFARGLYFR